MKNEIAAVVVTYNRKELLSQCISKILNQKEISCDVVIVDNASTDGTSEMIREQFNRPEIIYINTGANLGGAGGFQVGVKRAVVLGYQYVWIMDDDTLPYLNSLKELMLADDALKGQWGCLSSVAYWRDGKICKANRQKKTLYKFVTDKELSDKSVKVQMASFVSLLVKTSVIKEVGLPIGEYFIWTDDYEFTGRISRKKPIYVIPDSKVLHDMKENKKINFAKETSDRVSRYKYVYRNDVHCYRQYGISGWCYIILKDVYTIFDILIHSKGEKLEKIKVIFQGFREGLRFYPAVEQIHSEMPVNADKSDTPRWLGQTVRKLVGPQDEKPRNKKCH